MTSKNKKYKSGFKCIKCGACCRDLDPYLNVELGVFDSHIPADLVYNDADHGRSVKRYMKRTRSSGLCIMLDPIKNRCMIYNYRPQECREFKPGCAVCVKVRNKLRSGNHKT